MNTFEIRTGWTLTDADLSALRWELFLFHEIVDVVRTERPDVLAILHEEEAPDTAAWLDALAALGYTVRTAEPERPEAA